MAEDPDPRDPPAPGVGKLTPSTAAGVRQALRELAAHHGVQLSYTDVTGRRRRAKTEPLIAVLRALGAAVDRAEDAPEALRAAQVDRPAVEPVAVAWNGRLRGLEVRTSTTSPVHCVVATEDGDTIEGLATPRTTAADRIAIDLPWRLPHGRHRLAIDAGGTLDAATTVVSAPRRFPSPTTTWGVFAPLYAIRSDRDWGAGDLTDLDALMRFVEGLGGGIVATLPMLAAFLYEPFEPSPYAPVSRLFWNELYCDPSRAPGLGDADEARALLASAELQHDLDRARSSDVVAYRDVARAKRRVLEALARHTFELPSDATARRAIDAFVSARPEVVDYARFRAACDRYGVGWSGLPAPLRDGSIAARDVDADDERFHLYAQWLVSEQMERTAADAADRSSGLYVDLPLGVHPDGYDVWRHREAFALDVCGGAPPDSFFRKGQNWGFPPLHPARIREDGYAYLATCVRQLARPAALLRIDHVMGLHRLFWVPNGMSATEGLYVRYRSKELYAVLLAEAARAGAAVVGEDLGTVPAPVRSSMRRHGMMRSYVLQYEVAPGADDVLGDVPARSLASPNTHDMPPFAAFWSGTDIDLRVSLGIAEPQDAEGEREDRRAIRRALVDELVRRGRLSATDDGEHAARSVLVACLGLLATSDAAVVVTALEDLWEEMEQQNVPGTTDEHPNWRRRFRYRLEQLPEVDGLVDTLEEIDRGRSEERR